MSTLFTNLISFVYAEPASNWQLGFQTPASPIAEGIFAFHDDLRVFLTGILCFVRYILFECLAAFDASGSKAKGSPASKGNSYRLVHASVLEIV